MTLWYNKVREARGLSPVVRIGSMELDARLSHATSTVKSWVHNIDAEYVKSVLHTIAESAEKFGISCAEKCINRFMKVRDLVDSRDIPKNRGSVSFFFKHIEHHQKRTKSSGSKQ
jgi:hypothetical protein